MNINRFKQRIRFGNFVYGLVGALLAGVSCFIAQIIHPDLPEFVYYIVIILGFLAGFFFGSTAILALLDTLGAA